MLVYTHATQHSIFPLDILQHIEIQTEKKPQAAIQNEIHLYVSVKACHPIEQWFSTFLRL